MAISPALLTLYADFVQQVHSAAAKPGSIYEQTSKGVRYLYARRTVGRVRIDSFVGPAHDPKAQTAAQQIRTEQALAKQRRKIISLLKRSGVPAPNTALGLVLDAMADAGLFASAVLIGTGAYQCYAPLIGEILPSASLTTQDADIATATLALAAESEGDSMLAILKRADSSFHPVPGLSPSSPPTAFRSASGFMVDLLTPTLRRSDRAPMPLDRLAAGAVPLQHLSWLIDEPVRAVALYGTGIAIRIPQPARFAIHKLIVAQKRGPHERGKRIKDLAQAKALIEALRRSDPFSLEDAQEDAIAQGKSGWAAPVKRSLAELGLSTR